MNSLPHASKAFPAKVLESIPNVNKLVDSGIDKYLVPAISNVVPMVDLKKKEVRGLVAASAPQSYHDSMIKEEWIRIFNTSVIDKGYTPYYNEDLDGHVKIGVEWTINIPY